MVNGRENRRPKLYARTLATTTGICVYNVYTLPLPKHIRESVVKNLGGCRNVRGRRRRSGRRRGRASPVTLSYFTRSRHDSRAIGSASVRPSHASQELKEGRRGEWRSEARQMERTSPGAAVPLPSPVPAASSAGVAVDTAAVEEATPVLWEWGTRSRTEMRRVSDERATGGWEPRWARAWRGRRGRPPWSQCSPQGHARRGLGLGTGDSWDVGQGGEQGRTSGGGPGVPS